MAKSGHKSISRIDTPSKRTHGWYVRVYFNRTMHSKFFSDSRYGDADAALAEAIIYRDEIEEKVGKPRTDRHVVTASPRNQSGVIGVQRKTKRSRTRHGKMSECDVYEITWNPEPNVIRRTSVSVDRYGEEEAFRRACIIRRKKEQEMYGRELQISAGS
ncbi:MAG: AP2 domain-containing protein [Anaerolineae bacterium]|nr:AP2 domain-containing protein [Anaerolineae bacterium]